jgi:hypothetical protein
MENQKETAETMTTILNLNIWSLVTMFMLHLAKA